MTEPNEHLRDYAEWMTAGFEPFDPSSFRDDAEVAGPASASIAADPEADAVRPEMAEVPEPSVMTIEPHPIAANRPSPLSAPLLRVAAAILVIAVLGAGAVALRRDAGETTTTATTAQTAPPVGWTLGEPFVHQQLGELVSFDGLQLVWTGTEVVAVGAIPSTIGGMFPNIGASPAYNPETNTWRVLPQAPEMDLTTVHSVLWTGREILVFGAQKRSGVAPQPMAAALDPATGAWRGFDPPAGVERDVFYFSALWVGDRAILTARSGAMASFEPASGSWDLVRAAGPQEPPTQALVGSLGGSELMIVHEVQASGAIERVERFDIATGTSSPLASPPFTPDALTSDGSTLIASSRSGEVAVWVLENGSWRTASTNPITAARPDERREFGTTAWVDGRLVLWGEPPFAQTLQYPPVERDVPSDGVAYDPATDRWTMIPTLEGDHGWSNGIAAGDRFAVVGYTLRNNEQGPTETVLSVAHTSVTAVAAPDDPSPTIPSTGTSTPTSTPPTSGSTPTTTPPDSSSAPGTTAVSAIPDTIELTCDLEPGGGHRVGVKPDTAKARADGVHVLVHNSWGTPVQVEVQQLDEQDPSNSPTPERKTAPPGDSTHVFTTIGTGILMVGCDGQASSVALVDPDGVWR